MLSLCPGVRGQLSSVTLAALLVQVMRAEAEAAEQEQREADGEDDDEVEQDSAFGSDRSSSLGHAPSAAPPTAAAPCRVESQEEGVASWASVRMLGERQRRRAEKEQEQEEVLNLLLKGSVAHYTSHDALGLVRVCSLQKKRRGF